jgi:perosamine synthetase
MITIKIKERMMDKFIPLSVPNLKANELAYVTEAIEEEWVSTGGSCITALEKGIAEYIGISDAVACQSGTAGLHLAMLVNDIGVDDEVIVPALTFIAAVNPVKYVGAEPVFMDCDDTLCMDMNKVEQFCMEECTFDGDKLTNKRTGKHVKAVVVVHVFGNVANMDKLMKIAAKYHLIVIEDSTEALGSYIKHGLYTGKFAGTIGKIGVYSFNGNKIITTGGGGMIVSDDKEILKKAKHLSTQAKSDELYYIHDEIGYNYRMTNLQAALGIAQLERLEEFIKIKKENYLLYKEKIKEIPGLSILNFNSNIRANYWFYSLKCDEEYPLNRDGLIKYLYSKGIQSRPIWGLISEQKVYLTNQAYMIEKAKYYLEHIVNIPCSTNLTKENVLYVVDCLENLKL